MARLALLGLDEAGLATDGAGQASSVARRGSPSPAKARPAPPVARPTSLVAALASGELARPRLGLASLRRARQTLPWPGKPPTTATMVATNGSGQWRAIEEEEQKRRIVTFDSFFLF